METFQEVKASTPEEKAAYQKWIEERSLVYEILTFAAYYFHVELHPTLRSKPLFPFLAAEDDIQNQRERFDFRESRQGPPA